MKRIPEHIVSAVNALLAPYGEKYTPGDAAPPVARSGYKSRRDACAYLGCSVSTLDRLVVAGALRPIKLTGAAKNSKVVFAIADLEAYVESRRAG